METTVRQATSNIAVKQWRGDFSQLVQLMGQAGFTCHFFINSNPNFPSYEVSDYTCNGGRCNITVNFMGLIGHHAALPTYYQGCVVDSMRQKNLALYDFISIYQHRIIDLNYQVWLSARPTVRSSYAINSIISGLAGVLSSERIPSISLLSYAGLLRRQPLSRCSIEAILNDYFNLPMSINDFESHYLYLAKSDMTRVGKHGCVLGKDTVIGEKIRQRQGKCTIDIGPLDFSEFSKLLPHALFAKSLRDLLHNLIPKQFDIQVRLWLKSTAVPKWRLNTVKPQRLGLTTWCHNNCFSSKVGDVIYMVR